MADNRPAHAAPGEICSAMIWHLPLLRRSAATEDGYTALAALWNALAAAMPSGFLVPPTIDTYPILLPSREALQHDADYQVLCYRREATPPGALDNDYAYVYAEHDVVGLVVLWQSREAADWSCLEKKLLEAGGGTAKKILKDGNDFALGSYVTWANLTDQDALPSDLLPDARQPSAFVTARGFHLWSLRADGQGRARVYASVGKAPKVQLAFQGEFIGPGASVCAPYLRYQVSAAKVGWLTADFNREYASDETGIRRHRKQVKAQTEGALQSGSVPAATLLDEQKKEGYLATSRRDLKKHLITLGIHERRMERTRQQGTDAASQWEQYRRDRERAERLREAIEAEIAYLDTTIDLMQAARGIFSANLEQERVRTEQETSYRNLVQTSLIGGTVLAMTAVQVLDKYEYPELKWPLVALAGAVGYGLPILALRLHIKEKRGADRAAVALLFATGVTLLLSYVWEISRTFARGRPLTTPLTFTCSASASGFCLSRLDGSTALK